MTNRFKGLDLVDKVPEELWMQVQKEAVNKTIPKKKKAKWLSEEALEIAQERRQSVGDSELEYSVQFSSVTQSCPTLCDPINRSMSGFPVHHQLPEFTQTHVHRVSDAIQPSHPLSSPSPPAPNLSQHEGLFQWVHSSHEVAKVLEFQLQHQSFQWTFRTDLFRMDWLDLLAVQVTLKSLLQQQNSKSSFLQHSAFFIVQLSHPYITTGKTIALTRQTFVGKVVSLLFNMLSGKRLLFHCCSHHLQWFWSPQK